ncbi:hypothetical protein PR048_032414 [Dryococelus australis]|uniref:G-protein coupled receptors family 1 profile domain-containing protein n=1 Tax=Dryococelus australis TaxID=614101 RepID=A0ABQ9G256_9NEOP|nr:hypothetical protein PR048_032414 [Dryococelus australis]
MGEGQFSAVDSVQNSARPQAAAVRIRPRSLATPSGIYTAGFARKSISPHLHTSLHQLRKHRLLYRCCLISLACSDIMITISSGLSNTPKFLLEAHNIWKRYIKFNGRILKHLWAISTLASHQGEPGSIPGRVTGFSQVGIVPDDAVGRRVFSGLFSFPRPFIPVLLHIHFNHPHWLSRPRWFDVAAAQCYNQCVWAQVMGQFLCSFVPFLQTMSILASSMTLFCIAVDRYFVVTQAVRTYWNPGGFACLACVVAIWASSAGKSGCAEAVACGGASQGVAFPMYGHYMWRTVVMQRDSGQSCVLFHVCLLKTKVVKFQYYLAVFSIIFLPLFSAFVVLYCLVLRFLWTRKWPGASKPFIAPAGGGGPGDAKAGGSSSAAGARESRKTRTVKAILTLMVTFVCLRMPSWVFLLYTSVPNNSLTGMGWWLAQNVFSAMVLLNSAINPFIYCFLTQMMSAWDSLTDGCCRLAGRSQTTDKAVEEEVKCCPLQSPQMMIPRGPYSVQEPSGESTAAHQPRADGQNGSSTVMSSLDSSPHLASGRDTRGPTF